jgi:quercetin dioxygenase-like cupin family protein
LSRSRRRRLTTATVTTITDPSCAKRPRFRLGVFSFRGLINTASAEVMCRKGRMAHVGKTIDHPLSGERLTFLETSATTGGSYLKMRLEMRPGGALPRPHTHPRAEERFEVAEGRVQIVTSGKTRAAEAGETVVVPRGADHVWGNPFDDPAAVVVTTNPALNLETFFETWFGLARDGKVNSRTQSPAFLQAVLVLHDFRAEIGMPGLAGVAMRGLGPVVSPLARARGYRSMYPRYSDPESP